MWWGGRDLGKDQLYPLSCAGLINDKIGYDLQGATWRSEYRKRAAEIQTTPEYTQSKQAKHIFLYFLFYITEQFD